MTDMSFCDLPADPSACLLRSAPAMWMWSPDSPAEGVSCKQKTWRELTWRWPIENIHIGKWILIHYFEKLLLYTSEKNLSCFNIIQLCFREFVQQAKVHLKTCDRVNSRLRDHIFLTTNIWHAGCVILLQQYRDLWLDLVRRSCQYLASVSVVASRVLFVAAFRALATTGAATAAHTARTADTVSVTWERNDGGESRERLEGKMRRREGAWL